VMFEFTKGLGERGIECDMLCADCETKSNHVIELSPDAHIICRKAIAKIAATTIAPDMVLWLCRHCREYDVIHIHHPDPMAALALRLSGYKGKVILHWHSDILKQKFLLKLYLPLQKWLIGRADRVVGTSPVYVKESPYLADCREKLTYLPIGVDEMKASAASVQRIKEKFQGKKLLFSVGRLVEYKGFDYLVEAVSYLPEEYRLILGGQGPLRNQLEQKCRDLGITGRVEFLGWIDEKDLPDWFEACNVFVLSSIHKTEAFAIVQVEAMSCGKPVISTRIPGSGVSWVNEDGVSGITVPVRDAKAIADAILEICGDRDKYGAFSKGSRARYESLFTREKMISSLLGLYQDVLSQRNWNRQQR